MRTLKGQIYDFGSAEVWHHITNVADEVAERLAICDSGDGDDEEARGDELATFLKELAHDVRDASALNAKRVRHVIELLRYYKYGHAIDDLESLARELEEAARPRPVGAAQ